MARFKGSTKGVCDLVLQVEDRSRRRGASAVLWELQLDGGRAPDHQRWQVDDVGRVLPRHCNYLALEAGDGGGVEDAPVILFNMCVFLKKFC